MLVVYDSRFGSGKAFAEKLGMSTQSVNEALNEECVLVTRNEGFGEIPQATKEFLAQKGYNPIYGARPLKRFIEQSVEDNLAEEILIFHMKLSLWIHRPIRP